MIFGVAALSEKLVRPADGPPGAAGGGRAGCCWVRSSRGGAEGARGTRPRVDAGGAGEGAREARAAGGDGAAAAGRAARECSGERGPPARGRPPRLTETLGRSRRQGANFSPAAARNRGPIADVLGRHLPPTGRVLEVASGSGQHVAYLAPLHPGLQFQPTEYCGGGAGGGASIVDGAATTTADEERLRSIEAWTKGMHVSLSSLGRLCRGPAALRTTPD